MWCLKSIETVCDASGIPTGKLHHFVLNPDMNPYLLIDGEEEDTSVRYHRFMEKTSRGYTYITKSIPSILPPPGAILSLNSEAEKTISSFFATQFDPQHIKPRPNLNQESLRQAIETLKCSFLNTFHQQSFLDTFKTHEKAQRDIQNLGFQTSILHDNTIEFTIPNRDLLLHNIKTLFPDHEAFKHFDINPTTGFLDDLSFITSSLTHDALGSNECEEKDLHDYAVHILPTLIRILTQDPDSGNSYNATLTAMRTVVSTRLGLIRYATKNKKLYPHADALLFSLSAAIDVFTTSVTNDSRVEESFDELMFDERQIWSRKGPFRTLSAERFPDLAEDPRKTVALLKKEWERLKIDVGIL
ncbi:MAG TPA: hypothetical protein VJK48_01910 [Chlamydiales bacterium]|nr:hypothetical protein [Chlamydiales bacterium]